MIVYEWVIEVVEVEENDVVDLTHADTFSGAKKAAAGFAPNLKPGHKVEIGLVRDRGDEVDGLQDRQWAYVGYIEDGKLPPTFDGGAKVPQRFLCEVERENGRKGGRPKKQTEGKQ